MQYLYYGGAESLLIKNNEIMEVRYIWVNFRENNAKWSVYCLPKGTWQLGKTWALLWETSLPPAECPQCPGRKIKITKQNSLSEIKISTEMICEALSRKCKAGVTSIWKLFSAAYLETAPSSIILCLFCLSACRWGALLSWASELLYNTLTFGLLAQAYVFISFFLR